MMKLNILFLTLNETHKSLNSMQRFDSIGKTIQALNDRSWKVNIYERAIINH